ncbi:GNAT family N-acetyltransferase [Microbulbifer mangrovi]|uniref:GNAT family N-acetyltransferase n=1 Tax=Microbulbifer mangrovi TaxID=927787 RepID=UPI001EFB1227|nr:GNAT family N-acetyltransferase [Microbulbifer mangrovi]
MQQVKIQVDDLSDGAIIQLLEAHLAEMRLYSPPDSIHALDTPAMKHSSITFWGARVDGELVACGALKQLSPEHGEIKSMRTEKNFLRQGIAARLLERILQEAKSRCYKRVSLETGTNEAFAPAVSLYRRFGFEDCGPFGTYLPDPFSRFLSKSL